MPANDSWDLIQRLKG